MTGSHRHSRRRLSGFTMVELLTVIAIVAVLATLLMTALSTAQKKSRRVVCTGNLRQISLALNMYLDDFPRRPLVYDLLVSGRYLPAKASFLCPEDKTGNWGGIVQGPPPLGFGDGPEVTAPLGGGTNSSSLRHSYLHPLPWEEWAWKLLEQHGPNAGISACQLHGLGKPDPDSPSIRDYEGLVLRARRDGAVIRRQVYWNSAFAPHRTANPGFNGAVAALPDESAGADYPWELFVDELPTPEELNPTAQPPAP